MFKLIGIILCSIFITNAVAVGDKVVLSLKPSKCVTLKEGKTCYEDVNILWRTPNLGHYCLMSNNINKPLKCWLNHNQGSYSFEFKHAHSMQYHLVDMSNKNIIAKRHFSVKWVYKNRPTNSWRLF